MWHSVHKLKVKWITDSECDARIRGTLCTNFDFDTDVGGLQVWHKYQPIDKA